MPDVIGEGGVEEHILGDSLGGHAKDVWIKGVDLSVSFPGQPPSTATSVTGALGAAAVITYAAVVGQTHRLTMLNAAATAPSTLTVVDGATTILSLSVPTGSLTVPLPPGGIQGTTNTAMTITVAGVTAQTMTVNAAKVTA